MLHSRDSHLKHLSNLNAAFYFGTFPERNDLLNNSSLSFNFPGKGPLPFKIKDEEGFSSAPVNIMISDDEDSVQGDPRKLNKDKIVAKQKEITYYSSSKTHKEDLEFSFSRENSMLMGPPRKKMKVGNGEEIIGIPQRISSLKKPNVPGRFETGDKVKKILNGKFAKNKEIVFFVEWKSRSDGIKPGNSRVTSKELRKYDADFLLDFYESRFATYKKKDGDCKLTELLANMKKKENEK